MEYEKMKWLIWNQEGYELQSTQENDWSQVKVQESKFIQEVSPNQELKLKSTFIFPQWNVAF